MALAGRTKTEIHRDALVRRIDALNQRVASLRVKTVPWINSHEVIRAADLKIRKLERQIAPLRDERRAVEAEMQRTRELKRGKPFA